MARISSILLIGALSMLFAEVFSGASQVWYLNPWGFIITFPLYMAHVIFLLTIGLKIERVSLSQLYLFGVIFSLYESWITKVLWIGYGNAPGPWLGVLLGLAMPEFLILLFWHPVMSFIVPILTFEVLTQKSIQSHNAILTKTRNKNILIAIYLICISPFVANGNGFDILSANMSLIGTLLIVFALYYLAKNTDIKSIELGKVGFIITTIYLIGLYVFMFFNMRPEKIPTTIMSYISIITIYALVIILILKTQKVPFKIINLTDNHYTIKDFIRFAILMILFVNIYCIIPNIGLLTLIITYILLIGVGSLLFTVIIIKTLKDILFKQKMH